MAVWQFDFHLVPSQVLGAKSSNQMLTISRDEFDSIDWWANAHIDLDDLRNKFSTLLCKRESWSSQIEMWGVEDGDRIDMMIELDRLEELFVRLDIRSINDAFIINLLNLAKSKHWSLITEDYRIIDADYKSLLSAMRHSDAFKFVGDPIAFLKRLEN